MRATAKKKRVFSCSTQKSKAKLNPNRRSKKAYTVHQIMVDVDVDIVFFVLYDAACDQYDQITAMVNVIPSAPPSAFSANVLGTISNALAHLLTPC